MPVQKVTFELTLSGATAGSAQANGIPDGVTAGAIITVSTGTADVTITNDEGLDLLNGKGTGMGASQQFSAADLGPIGTHSSNLTMNVTNATDGATIRTVLSLRR